MSTPDLSIVIASHEAAGVLPACLGALFDDPAIRRAEVILADSSAAGVPAFIARDFPDIRLIQADAPLTIPELRGRAIAAARAPVVAVIDPYSVVSRGWIDAVLRAHQECPHPAIGGSVDLHATRRRSIVAWALFINEYGMFMPPVRHGATWILPGSNVSYKRAALFDGDRPRYPVFWKTFVNESVHGGGLLLDPRLAIALLKPIRFGEFLRSRIDHGRCYAGMRSARAGAIERLVRAATAPALPFVFLWRWGRVYVAKRRHLSMLLLTLPHQGLLFGAWALGEFLGYARGPGRSCRRLFY